MDDIQGSRIDFCNGEEYKLPAYLIHLVFENLLGEEWTDKLEHLHLHRRHQWKADVHINSDGGKDYRLYTLRYGQAVCSSAISINQGTIETFSILSKDAAPLLEKIFADFPPVFQPKYHHDRHYFFTNFYRYPADKKYMQFPQPIADQREATQNIEVNYEVFSAEIHCAGDPSGLKEMITALKCMEVLMA
jgi:hypothetical protein